VVPTEAGDAPDFGNAIYDLSQGSSANRLLQDVASEPVHVHAIACTKPGFEGQAILAGFESVLKVLAMAPMQDCQGCPRSRGTAPTSMGRRAT